MTISPDRREPTPDRRAPPMPLPAPAPTLVRPFAITGGRVLPPGRGLDIAALLFTTDRGRRALHDLDNEDRDIALLCRDLQSIAEVSARLRLPLGVVRVLVGDLAERGVLSIQPPIAPPSEHSLSERFPSEHSPSVNTDLLERLLSGLRRL
ncbi:MAG: DUF742 domain-containing protein [Frankia sp.]